MEVIGLPTPKIAELNGYGQLIRSGLTDPTQRILEDAFTPGRNMLFLLTAAAYAYQVGADAVSIGLLNEASSLFPDQTSEFVRRSEDMISLCLGRKIRVLTPLSAFQKRDVVMLANSKGISSTYSCHAGAAEPCGACIACNEFKF
jgi:7-cyano-7-deazaguanine synthase